MKKKNGLIAIGIVTLVATGFAAYLTLNSVNEKVPLEPIKKIEQSVHSDFEGGSIQCGYLSSMHNGNYIASTYEEFEEYCNNHNNYSYDGYGNIVKETGKLNSLIEKYDEEYFKQKSLALIYVQLSSGSNSVEFLGATKEANSVRMHYRVVYPAGGVGTCDMSGYIVFAEIDKDITSFAH